MARAGRRVEGVVFLDADRDGVRGSADAGVPGVAVTDGERFAQTGPDGRFSLAVGGGARFVYLAKPDGFDVPRGPGGAPRFYHTIAPAGRDGPLELPLAPRSPRRRAGSAVVLGDVHVANDAAESRHYNDPRWRANQDPCEVLAHVARAIGGMRPSLVLTLGDLVARAERADAAKTAEWFDLLDARLEACGAPTWRVMGNHEFVGLDREDVAPGSAGFGSALFESRYGPTYYSFDHAGTRYTALHPYRVRGRELRREAGTRFLAWLRSDLARPHRGRRVFLCHEPLVGPEGEPATAAARDVLRLIERAGGGVVLSGHEHVAATRRLGGVLQLVVPAVSGAWWGPEFNSLTPPAAARPGVNANLDGTPQGFGLLDGGARRAPTYRYKPLGGKATAPLPLGAPHRARARATSRGRGSPRHANLVRSPSLKSRA